MLFKLAVNNIFSRKSSIVIILFIAFTTGLFGIANAFFDSTDNGLQQSYIQNFTGDLIITPKTKIQLSLFGDETPVTGNLSKIPLLEDCSRIDKILNSNKLIDKVTTQITVPCIVEKDKIRQPIYLFGVNSEKYLSIMKGIKITDGTSFNSNEKGVLISTDLSKKLKANIGDKIQFLISDGPTFRIRSGIVSGIFSTSTNSDVNTRYILSDQKTALELLGNDGNEDEIVITNDKADLLNQDLDFDDLFSEDLADSSSSITEIHSEKIISDESKTNNLSHFYLIKLTNSKNAKKAITKINKEFRKNNISAVATDWRHAAGSSALYLYWIRVIFNVGICIILICGYIIVNNTLIINVLDRTKELGTMRAFGTSKTYISIECFVETLILTCTGGFIGLIFATIATKIINSLHIILTNSFLIQLFGSNAIRINLTPNNITVLIQILLLLSIAGWIIPVFIALRVTPIQAMREAK